MYFSIFSNILVIVYPTTFLFGFAVYRFLIITMGLNSGSNQSYVSMQE